MTTQKPNDLVITVRLSAGAYTARARGEKVTASSSISAEAAAQNLANKLGHELAQLDLFAGDRQSEDGAVQFLARPPRSFIACHVDESCGQAPTTPTQQH